MLAPGNIRQVYEALRDRWRVGDYVGAGDANPLMAQMVLGMRPSWYVLTTIPAQERLAGAHLAGRRFGVFLPQAKALRIKRGRQHGVLVPMFPGYVFVFTWLDGRNYRRIVSCPGVLDFLRRVSGHPAPVSDSLIDAVRMEENKQQPLTVDCEAVGVFKKGRRGFRRFRKIIQDQQTIDDSQIIGVHTWSALRDDLQQLDGAGRNRLLHEALGVA